MAGGLKGGGRGGGVCVGGGVLEWAEFSVGGDGAVLRRMHELLLHQHIIRLFI